MNNFNGECIETLLKIIDDKNINAVIIPANCTYRLQPLDLSVNKAVKTFLRKASGLVCQRGLHPDRRRACGNGRSASEYCKATRSSVDG